MEERSISGFILFLMNNNVMKKSEVESFFIMPGGGSPAGSPVMKLGLSAHATDNKLRT